MAIKPVEILITAKDKASAVFGSLKATAIAAGIAIAGYFGIRAFAGAIEGAAELEAKLSEVKAVAGATAEEMVLMRRAAEEAGASTKYTATESAEALGNLARAGLDVGASVAALPGVLALAQSGGIGLAESAEITTKALAGFGYEAEKAGLIADVLAKGANASNTSVLGLAQGLSYAAPTAKSLNLSLETTVALLGKFADGGIDASRGGTALNAILSQFLDPASKFRTELASMGIVTNDFEQALRQLAAAGPAGQKAILAVGTEAGPALRSLLNQGIGAFDELKAKLDDAAGSAAATAETMENNLQGAMRGLASAWDTVTNALGTPVLPVLKEGVAQLTASLREAVSNGTVAKFGDAIARGFQAALTWARAFLNEVDFDAMAAKVSSAADQVGTAFDKLGTYATNTGNTVQTVWGVMGAGVNVVLTGIYALGTAFTATAATIVKGAAMASEALAKIAVTDSAKAKLLDDAAAMREVLAGLTGVTQEFVVAANKSMDGVATSAQLARDGWAGLTGASTEAAAQATASQAAFQSVAETLKEVGGDAEATGQKAKAAAILQTEAARQTRVEVEALKREYEAALQAGDVQTALGKLQQMQDKLRQTSDQAQTTGQDVANAFERMGVQTKGALKQAAENAKRDFDLIKGSGQATADGLQQAFQRYAEAAIAANGGVATASVQAEAGMRGLEIVTDSTGKSVVRAMNDAKAATEAAGDAAHGASGGYRSMANAANAAAEAAQKASAAKYSSPLGPDKYSAPKGGSTTGNTREERLAGQNAVDNTLAFRLRDKLKSGTLGAEDAADIQAVIAALDQNEQVNRDVDRMNPGAFSSEGMADRREWQNIRTQLAQALTKTSVGRTVQVNINTGQGQETVNTDEAGARALVRGLSKAARRAGR